MKEGAPKIAPNKSPIQPRCHIEKMVLLTPSTGVTVFDSAFFEFVLPVWFSQ